MLKGFFAETLQLTGGEAPEDLYQKMNNWAEQAAGNGLSLGVDTRFKGTRNDPSLRGSISGIGMENFTPGALCLGVLEGICTELHELSKGFIPPLPQSKKLAVSGGGVRSSKLMQHLLKDTFKTEIAIPVNTEEAAYGAALISAVSAGIIGIDRAGSLIGYEI